MATTITGTASVGLTLTTATQDPVLVEGTIATTGSYAIYGTTADAWSITNLGAINASGVAIDLAGQGTVDNGSGSHISGGIFGIIITNAGSVQNAGVVSANTLAGVALTSGGSVTNASTGTIAGGASGVAIGGPGSLSNSGLIEATKAGNYSFGIAAGGTSGTSLETIFNGGTIIGGVGVALSAVSNGTLHTGTGTVTNAGTIEGTTGTAIRFGTGAERLIDDPGAVFIGKVLGATGKGNSDVLELAHGTSAGTLMGLGSSFTNFATVTVDAGATWTVAGGKLAGGSLFTDAGTLISTGTLIDPGQLIDADRMTNFGAIVGRVTLAPGAFLDNAGAIDGSVLASGTGTAPAGVTLVNAGLIASPSGTAGSAVQLGKGNDRLILEPGAAFIGKVNGGSGNNVLELAGSPTSIGTLSSLGTQIGAFPTVQQDSGSTWRLLGRNSAGTVSDAGRMESLKGDTLSVSGTLTVLGTLGSAGTLALGGGTVSAKVVVVQAPGSVTLAGGTLTASALRLAGIASGFGSISGAVSNTGAIAASGGTLLLTSAVSGTGTLDVGIGKSTGLLELKSGAAAMETIAFSAGTLRLDNLQATLAPIKGFAAGDTIDLTGVVATGAKYAAGVLTLTKGGRAVGKLKVVGTYSSRNFHLSSLAGSVTAITFVSDLPCFAEGTRILTDAGDVPVERLHVGDRAVVLPGRLLAPIRWIGRRSVACARHPHPRNVWPVRVRAGAFGAGRPVRDIWLSPDHAVFAAGVLIPVRYLVNGASIVQEHVDRVTYFHVELPRHQVVLAEGLPCESFLDTGNRAAFGNSGPAVHLHPDFGQRLWDGDACAPLVVAGPTLDRVRAGLQDRANSLKRGVNARASVPG